MEDWVAQIRRGVQEADLVLVGLGEEFGLTEKGVIGENPDLFAAAEESEQQMGYLVRQSLRRRNVPELSRAYGNLCTLLERKNYFLVSVNTDDMLKRMPLLPERMVLPCGGYEKLQCPSGCADVWGTPDREWDAWAAQRLARKAAPCPPPAKCPHCGRELVFHNIFAENYREDGYQEQWNRYTKWLQGTVNHKVCVLELGVGLRFPTAIRWPFEKIAAYNRKAVFFRIHGTLPQLPDTLEGRGVPIKENSVHFFANKFVQEREL